AWPSCVPPASTRRCIRSMPAGPRPIASTSAADCADRLPMPVRLHADDLGLHPAVDRAIFRAFEAGALAGASILATGPTFRAAAATARSLGLPLSLHLAIVDTAPLSPPREIPSLVG